MREIQAIKSKLIPVLHLQGVVLTLVAFLQVQVEQCE